MAMDNEKVDLLRRKLQHVQLKLGLDHRFYWGVVCHFPVEIDPEFTSAYVKVDGKSIILGEKAAELDTKRLFGLLGFAVNHIIFHHTSPAPPVKYPTEWRYAQEIEAEMHVPPEFSRVNDELTYVARDYSRRGLVTCAQIYMDRIKRAYPPSPPAIISEVAEAKDVDTDKVQIKILTAYETAKSAGYGKLPAGVELFIDKLRAPRINWREKFRAYWGNKLGKWDLVTTRYASNFIPLGFFLPPLAQIHGVPDVIIGIDTSGSMVGEPLKEIFSEIRGLSGVTTSVTVMFIDAAVQEVVTLEDFGDDEIEKASKLCKGGGGTSFVPFFEEIKNRNLRPQLAIYFTDLYGDFPEEQPPYPVLWVTMSKGVTVPFGDILEIPQEEFADGAGGRS